MKRPTLKALAEQSGCSRRTLFRVLRGDPCVKPATREALVRLLNIHGYMVENRTATEKIVVDVSVDNLYAERLADKVLERLKLENYRTVKTASCSHPAKLRKELEDADAVIFSGDNGDWFRIARDINPAIYRVGLFCPDSREAELNIAADNLGGTRNAADFLCRKFGRIAVFLNTLQTDSAERAAIFYGHAAAYYPQVRCDLIRYQDERELPRLYAEHKLDYDAYFYQNGSPWVILAPLLKRDKAKTYCLMFNNPAYITRIRELEESPKLDAYIDFDVDRLQDFAAFFLRNRPLLREQPRLLTLLPTKLIENKTTNHGGHTQKKSSPQSDRTETKANKRLEQK